MDHSYLTGLSTLHRSVEIINYDRYCILLSIPRAMPICAVLPENSLFDNNPCDLGYSEWIVGSFDITL